MSIDPVEAETVWRLYVDGGSVADDDPFFERVDGFASANSLVALDVMDDEGVLNLPDAERQGMRQRMWEMVFNSCKTDRSMREYESDLRIAEGMFPDLLRQYCKISGIDSASLVDFCCGDGYGFEELCALNVIERNKSVGVTLPWVEKKGEPPLITPMVSARILVANILHLKPKILFDIALSNWGAPVYHPYGPNFAILQLINSLKVKGMLMVGPLFWHSDYVDKEFFDLGILRCEDIFNQFGHAGNHPSAYILERRPTSEEIKRLSMKTTSVLNISSQPPL